MVEPIKFRKKAGAKNKGIIISFPNELKEWLNISPGTEIIMEPLTGKYGKYVALYTNETSGENNDPETTE